MSTEITMPQLGESVTEGTISKWLVKPGDQVKKYDPLAEVLTDKVSAEVPSSYSGTVTELAVSEDETVEVGNVICYIQVDGEETQTTQAEEEKQSLTAANEDRQSQKKRYSPAVLRLSQEHNIDLSTVEGTGKGGRITRKDLQLLIEQGAPVKQANEAIEKEGQESSRVRETFVQKKSIETSTSNLGDVEVPVTGVRKAIATNMVKSKHEAPHAWTMVEADVTSLVGLRNSVKNEFKQKEGITLTYLPFFIKAVVEALKEFPQVNALWAGDKIIQKKDVHISIAVATEEALFVPVLKHADEKSIKGIAKEINDLATKVRNGAIANEEMQGGTFTVNNTGSFGSVLSAPIINSPQAAILSVESIVKRPVVIEHDAIAIRSMVNLCMSLDHRILDGLICGRFLARVKEKLETFSNENTTLY